MKREPTTRINLILSSTMISALRAAAKREKRTYSSIMREALADYLGIPDGVQLGGKFAKRDEETPEEVGV